MIFRAYADNVVIQIEPLEQQTKSGLYTPHSGAAKARGHRSAVVLASGPGHINRFGKFVPNEVKAGDRVIVDALAGQDYAMDLSVPRHNKTPEFQELFGDRGEFRIVREEEILGILDEEQAAE